MVNTRSGKLSLILKVMENFLRPSNFKEWDTFAHFFSVNIFKVVFTLFKFQLKFFRRSFNQIKNQNKENPKSIP